METTGYYLDYRRFRGLGFRVEKKMETTIIMMGYKETSYYKDPVLHS